MHNQKQGGILCLHKYPSLFLVMHICRAKRAGEPQVPQPLPGESKKAARRRSRKQPGEGVVNIPPGAEGISCVSRPARKGRVLCSKELLWEVVMEEIKEISQAVISRLPRYFRYLGELKDEGVERISSQDLSELMKVTASQIRQDFNNFGGFGQQGYGYNVEYLYTEIGRILGLDKTHKFVIIGAGNLGQALGGYLNFERRGFIFSGMFDKNPALVGKEVRGIKVQSMDCLDEFVRNNDIDIAVLTIPKTSAIEVADRLAKNGIKAIWNFAHVDLNLPQDIQVENVHLSDSLMKLSYNLNRNSMEQDNQR